MPPTLQALMLAPDTRPQVIAGCCTLIDQQVRELSGVSGTAVKLAYKTINSILPGHVRFMVESLLPDMVAELEPFWADFSSSGGADFGDYLAKRGDEVAQSLLAVTDARAANSGRPVVIKAYGSVRGSAGKHIQAALPRVGELVRAYAS